MSEATASSGLPPSGLPPSGLPPSGLPPSGLPPSGLPSGLVAYRRTPVFDENTIPAGLRREHRTAAGVWGVITVLEGRLRFRTLHPVNEAVLTPGARIAVAPEQPHEVALDGPVRFFVEFYRAAELASSGGAQT
jgi:tellurite resistance-related uncharacterized protein